MDNFYLGAILLVLIAIYAQGEMCEATLGHPKSIVGLVCSVLAPIVLIVGAFTH